MPSDSGLKLPAPVKDQEDLFLPTVNARIGLYDTGYALNLNTYQYTDEKEQCRLQDSTNQIDPYSREDQDDDQKDH